MLWKPSVQGRWSGNRNTRGTNETRQTDSKYLTFVFRGGISISSSGVQFETRCAMAKRWELLFLKSLTFAEVRSTLFTTSVIGCCRSLGGYRDCESAPHTSRIRILWNLRGTSGAMECVLHVQSIFHEVSSRDRHGPQYGNMAVHQRVEQSCILGVASDSFRASQRR